MKTNLLFTLTKKPEIHDHYITLYQGRSQLEKVTNLQKVKTPEITRDDVIAGTEQFELPLISLYFISKYAVVLKLQK